MTSRLISSLRNTALIVSAAVAPLLVQAGGIDPNTFLVGHPASPRWKLVHANAEHPAVQVRQQQAAGIDTNTFRVQPPAHAEWLTAYPRETESSAALIAAQ